MRAVPRPDGRLSKRRLRLGAEGHIKCQRILQRQKHFHHGLHRLPGKSHSGETVQDLPGHWQDLYYGEAQEEGHAHEQD